MGKRSCSACMKPWANPPRRHTCANPGPSDFQQADGVSQFNTSAYGPYPYTRTNPPSQLETCRVCGNLERPKAMKGGVCKWCHAIHGKSLPTGFRWSNGDTKAGPYPWREKQAQYAGYTDAQLQYAHKDALEAAKAMKGYPAESWYHDDAFTIRDEIEYRQDPKRRRRRPKSASNPGTLADGAESWARRRGMAVPPRGSVAWKGMFSAWQRAGMAQNPKRLPPKGTRTHKLNCTCAACRNSFKAKAVRRLDHFIVGDHGLRQLVKRTQAALIDKMRRGRYAPSVAPTVWLRLVNAAVKKFARKDPKVRAVFTRVFRSQIAHKIAREFEQKIRAHRNPVAEAFVGGVAAGATGAAVAHALSRRKNPSLAVVGRSLGNPGPMGPMPTALVRRMGKKGKGYTATPGAATQGPKTVRNRKGDRGLRRVLQLGQAREMAQRSGAIREFNAAVAAHKKFHGYKGTLPDDYPVMLYQIADGKKKTTTKFGSATGRVPETTYHRTPADSNKAGKFWVHEHPPGGEPLEVWLPIEKMAIKVGGTMKRTDWYRQ